MTDNFIQLKKDNLLRLRIKDSEGKDTGEYLEFQLDDIELPLKYQEIQERVKKNQQWFNNQLLIINKREDVKGKKMLSKNEEDRYKAINEFYKKQAEVYDMFLGENGVKKLLGGRKISWETFVEIDEIIDEQIMPFIEKNTKNMVDRIVEKYSGKDLENVIK